MKKILIFLSIVLALGCKSEPKKVTEFDYLKYSENILDYRITPKDSRDKSGLMYSDQGAWFAYGIPKTEQNLLGFSGPFLMTQQNGVWSNPIMSQLVITQGANNDEVIDFKNDLKSQKSFASHLEQVIENDELQIRLKLIFLNGNTAIQRFNIKNKTEFTLELNTSIQGGVFKNIGINLSKDESLIKLV